MTLKTGRAKYRGNVYTVNPTTGIAGYVCDDSWDINAVSFYHRYYRISSDIFAIRQKLTAFCCMFHLVRFSKQHTERIMQNKIIKWHNFNNSL